MQPASSNTRLGQLRGLLIDFFEGGVVITDPLHEVGGLGDVDADQVGFRTLVQLDGDMCVFVHAQALTSPEFLAAHERHLAHVQKVLTGYTLALRRWLRVPIWTSRVLGFGLMYTFAPMGDVASVVVLGVDPQLMTLAGATIGGVGIGALSRGLVRKLLHRNTSSRPSRGA